MPTKSRKERIVAQQQEPARRGERGVPIVPTEAAIPEDRSLVALRDAVPACRGCPLYARATQAVFGEGAERAKLMLVGEQPGDAEDRAGRPFVGPAGALLDRALEAAGIERSRVYLTNAVKHFNFELRGKARLHKKPRPGDVRACRPWLEAEIDVVKPGAIVLLGATAAQSLLGASFRVTERRGQIFDSEWAKITLATWHPSMALRAPDSESRERVFHELTQDLAAAFRALHRVKTPRTARVAR